MAFRIYQSLTKEYQGAHHSLWFKEADHDAAPIPGDQVELWTDGLVNEVHRRHYSQNLTLGVDLREILVNHALPLPAITNPFWEYSTHWEGPSIEELINILLESGWQKYIPGVS